MPSRLDGVRLAVGDLVAVELAPEPGWLQLLETLWQAGAALLPVDHRLPAPARSRLLARARPTVLVTEGGAHRCRPGVPVEEGTAAVLATSGTSGEPALVALGRGAVEAAVRASAAALLAGPQEPWLLCIPPAHIGGLLVLYRGLLYGAPVIVHSRFDPAAVATAHRARHTSMVPVMLRRMVEAGAYLAHLRTVLVGGDALRAELRERAAALGTRLVHTYGQTQSCGGVVYDGVPLPGVSVDIGSNSEVLLSGPTLMDGYRGDLERTERALRGGWLHTGDAGELDGDGRLVVHGRLDDVIITGGEKVWPAQVEAVLRRHPAVAEVAVVGEVDAEWGQRTVAVVVPAALTAPPRLDELRSWVREQLPAYAAPRDLVVLDALPATSGGKVRRRELRELVAQRSQRSPAAPITS